MPGHINQTVRQRLEKAGLWRTFRRRRDKLRDNGLAAAQANSQALRELLPPESEPVPPMPPELADRKAKESTVIRWVADNLDNPLPDPADCPAGAAWALLRHCRENEINRDKFLTTIWVRLIPNCGNESGEEEKWRTSSTLDPGLLSRIRKIAEACRNEP